MPRNPEQRARGLALLGKLVYFAHRPCGVLATMVVSCDGEGMVELMGMAGKFAPHLFVLAENLGEAGDEGARDAV